MTTLALVLAAGAFIAACLAIVSIHLQRQVLRSQREAIDYCLGKLKEPLSRKAEASSYDMGPLAAILLSSIPLMASREKSNRRDVIRKNAMAALASLGASETEDDEELEGIDYEGVLQHLRDRGLPV